MHYIIEEIDEDTSMEDLQKMMVVALIYRLLVCFYEVSYWLQQMLIFNNPTLDYQAKIKRFSLTILLKLKKQTKKQPSEWRHFIISL